MIDARLAHLVRSLFLLSRFRLPPSLAHLLFFLPLSQAYGLHIAKELSSSSSSSSAPALEGGVSQEEIIEAETAHADEVEKNSKGEIIAEQAAAPFS